MPRNVRGRGLALACLWLVAVAAGAAKTDDDDQPSSWVEAEMALPASSKPATPIRIDLGPSEENSFAVDADTLSVAADRVVRFMVVIVSPAGASTVTYEGIRCDTREIRRYASGRADGTWARIRSGGWQQIQFKAINAYPSTLYREFFCPGGTMVRDAAEAISALKRGGHPRASMRP